MMEILINKDQLCSLRNMKKPYHSYNQLKPGKAQEIDENPA